MSSYIILFNSSSYYSAILGSSPSFFTSSFIYKFELSLQLSSYIDPFAFIQRSFHLISSSISTLTGKERMTNSEGIWIELCIKFFSRIAFLISSSLKGMELPKQLIQPFSSLILIYLSLQITNPLFVSLNIWIQLQIKQVS